MCWIVDRMMVVKFVDDEDDGRVTCIFEAKETPRRTNMAFCSFPRGFAFFLPANEISPKHIPFSNATMTRFSVLRDLRLLTGIKRIELG